MLLQWHQQDPVSQREIDRNNAVYAIQKNRNPFIDNPSWVNTIWGQTPDAVAPQTPTN
jgi:endonuclease I